MLDIRVKGIDEAIRQLEACKADLERRMHDIIQRLADIGIPVANAAFANVSYQGEQEKIEGQVVWQDDTHAAVVVSGRTVLFLEFGAGATYGYGHPAATENGYGPGTWSDPMMGHGGKGRWNNPKGWYFAKGQKSWGNPPARGMYDAGKQMRESVAAVAREVFGT